MVRGCLGWGLRATAAESDDSLCLMRQYSWFVEDVVGMFVILRRHRGVGNEQRETTLFASLLLQVSQTEAQFK